MRAFICACAVIISLCAPAVTSAHELFGVSLEDVQGGGRLLSVSFYGRLPAPLVVDKIVRRSLEDAVLFDPSKDIVAQAFSDDDILNSSQWSGALIYNAEKKKIQTFDEYNGVNATDSQKTGYFVEVTEDKVFAGIEPSAKWIAVAVVFAKKPSRDMAYKALVAETQKLVARGYDISLAVYVGDQSVKASWVQMKEADGTDVTADYDASSRRLSHQEKTLKQF